MTLCSWHFEISQVSDQSKNMAAVDVHGCVIASRRYTLLYIRYADGEVYIQAWASALLVLADWAMREPRSVGRVTKVPRFFHVPYIKVGGLWYGPMLTSMTTNLCET